MRFIYYHYYVEIIMTNHSEFNDFTLFDIFIKNGLLYLIMSINNDPVSNKNLLVSINNKTLEFAEKYEKNSKEPILILTYKCDMQNNAYVYIKYKEWIRVFFAKYMSSKKKGFLALTTLFKDDYVYFPTYYNYYMKQGVDHFYMYYNGKVTPQIMRKLSYPNVTLIQWDYRYWQCQKKYKWGHHAQPGQLASALYKYGKYNYDYMIFNDMDEYFHIENHSLKSYIQANPCPSVFGFCNIWSKLINDNNIPNEMPYEFLVGSKKRYKAQSKNIYKLTDIKLIGIHEPYSFFQRKGCITDLNMYHFFSWNKKRTVNETWKKISL